MRARGMRLITRVGLWVKIYERGGVEKCIAVLATMQILGNEGRLFIDCFIVVVCCGRDQVNSTLITLYNAALVILVLIVCSLQLLVEFMTYCPPPSKISQG